MHKKKLFFLISSLCHGGAEKQTISLINKLDKKRFALYVGYLKKNETLLPELNRNGLSDIVCFHKRSKFDISLVKKVGSALNKIKPDIIVCVNIYPLFIAKIALMFLSLKCKTICILHSTIMKNQYNEIITKLMYLPLLEKADHLVFVSRNQKEYWLNHFKLKNKKISVIHNGIDIDHFNKFFLTEERKQELLQQFSIRQHEVLVGICAALRPEKRHNDLIDAISLLRKQGVDVGLLIIGDGPELERIRAHVKTMPEAENAIYFTGFQRDVRPFIALCDCMVLPSVAETFSIAALESMAMGKPLVMTNIGGASEQVRDGINGYLYEPGDIKALSHYLRQLNNSSIRDKMGRASKEILLQKFTIDDMVKSYANLFCKIAARV